MKTEVMLKKIREVVKDIKARKNICKGIIRFLKFNLRVRCHKNLDDRFLRYIKDGVVLRAYNQFDLTRDRVNYLIPPVLRLWLDKNKMYEAMILF